MDVKEAREVIRKAFADDPHFRFTYQASIAMFLFDNNARYNYSSMEHCNEMADRMIKLIFE